MQVWRLDPEVSPGEVGVDAAVLDEMVKEFEQTLAAGRLFHGAQMTVYRAGRRVLDVGGGLARVRTRVPVRPDTLFVLFSATKGLAGLAMLMLYERRKFHYDEPVTKYWPEFARVVPGKAAVTIRHVMSHRAGFPLGPRWLDAEKWGNRAEIRRAMEEVRLRFTPGERNAYHAMNYGHMLNELITRIDGRDCGAFLRDEVFGPLGLRDLHLGLPDDASLRERVAWCYHEIDLSPGKRAARATGVVSGELEQASALSEAMERAQEEAESPGADIPGQSRKPPARYADIPEMWHEFNWPETHRAVLPAAGAIGTARDLGALYAFLAQGGAREGFSLVSREGLAYVTTPTNREGEKDGTIGFPIRWGLGFHMGMLGRGSTLRSFGHAGAGGQVGFADPDRELAFSFATNGELAPEFQLWRYRLQSRAFEACR
ncbi:MAG TPA: serine hydrolase domain-containing protein [Myxococcota bacterium]|nr:serine hydrolase domain-containing protein [Myxococcota bacterium]